jgi:hypothetical protein
LSDRLPVAGLQPPPPPPPRPWAPASRGRRVYIGTKREGVHSQLPYYLAFSLGGDYEYELTGPFQMPDTLRGWHADGWRVLRHHRVPDAVLGLESVAAMRLAEGLLGWHVTGGAGCLRALDAVEDAWIVFTRLDEGEPLSTIKARLAQPGRILELEKKNAALADGSAFRAANDRIATLEKDLQKALKKEGDGDGDGDGDGTGDGNGNRGGGRRGGGRGRGQGGKAHDIRTVAQVKQAIAAGSLDAHLLRGRQVSSGEFEPPGDRVKAWCNVLEALTAAVDGLPKAVCEKEGAVPGLWNALRTVWPEQVHLSRAYPARGRVGASDTAFERQVQACHVQIVADLEASEEGAEDRAVEMDLADACVVACRFLLDANTKPQDFKRVLQQEVRFGGDDGTPAWLGLLFLAAFVAWHPQLWGVRFGARNRGGEDRAPRQDVHGVKISLATLLRELHRRATVLEDAPN